MNKSIQEDEYINVRITKSQAHFKRIKNSKAADIGVGNYFLILEVNAKQGAVYVPLSIASGKKTTGFIYQIEGTGVGSLSSAEVKASGEGVTQITLGTLQYAKIQQGKTASFRIQVEIKGKVGKEYTVVIHQINYKLSPTEARYKKFQSEVRTQTLKFR